MGGRGNRTKNLGLISAREQGELADPFPVVVMEDYSSLLRDHKKLEREKGLAIVKGLLKDPKEELISSLELTSLSLIATREKWEPIHGGLLVASTLIEGSLGSDDFHKKIQQAIPTLLEHEEPRIRLMAGKVTLSNCS